MYLNSFYLTVPVGNNAFSFDKRKNKKLYIPNLAYIDDLNDIKLGKEIVFEDFDFDGKLSSCIGLENFYKISIKNFLNTGRKQEIILFDNHNHAFYFWYETRKNGIIGDDNILVHIDEHSDMRDDGIYLGKPESEDLKKVFEFTNFQLNVGNYIVPAKKEGIIGEVIQIRSEEDLKSPPPNLPLAAEEGQRKIILNLDLDFFGPGLDYIDYGLKKKVIQYIAKKASLITVASSPFFVDQELALKVFRDLFE